MRVSSSFLSPVQFYPKNEFVIHHWYFFRVKNMSCLNQLKIRVFFTLILLKQNCVFFLTLRDTSTHFILTRYYFFFEFWMTRKCYWSIIFLSSDYLTHIFILLKSSLQRNCCRNCYLYKNTNYEKIQYLINTGKFLLRMNCVWYVFIYVYAKILFLILKLTFWHFYAVEYAIILCFKI